MYATLSQSGGINLNDHVKLSEKVRSAGSRYRDTDVENKRMHAKGGKWRGGGWWWDEPGDWD